MKTSIKQCFGVLIALSSSLFIIPIANALDVNISPKVATVDAVHNGEVVSIQRVQDQNNVLTGGYTKTSRRLITVREY